MNEKDYAIDEISQLLGIAETTLLSAVCAGLLKSRKQGEALRVSESALKTFLKTPKINAFIG